MWTVRRNARSGWNNIVNDDEKLIMMLMVMLRSVIMITMKNKTMTITMITVKNKTMTVLNVR